MRRLRTDSIQDPSRRGSARNDCVRLYTTAYNFKLQRRKEHVKRNDPAPPAVSLLVRQDGILSASARSRAVSSRCQTVPGSNGSSLTMPPPIETASATAAAIAATVPITPDSPIPLMLQAESVGCSICESSTATVSDAV